MRSYGPGLMYILRREAVDVSTAEDLFQEAFRIAIERLRGGALQEPEKLAGFVVGIARHLLKAHHRARRRFSWETLPAEEAAAPAESPYEQSCRLQAMELLEQCIEGLRVGRDRDLLRRRYLINEDKQSICRALGLTSQQYNRTLHRARGRLRKAMADTEAILWD